MKLSVVIPVYNEVQTLHEILEKVRATHYDKQIIMVDDYSTDGTRDLLKDLEKEPDLEIYYHGHNQGKGAALRTGFQYATGDVVLIQDADLEYDPGEYPILLRPIERGLADVVYGSRFRGSRMSRVHLYWHQMANNFLTWVSNMFTNLNLSDMETCYKVFRREVLDGIQIESNRFGFEPEITAKVARKRLDGRRVRIYEVPISYYGRDYNEGKKIGWKDGVAALWHILKFNLFS
ncbi:MAG: glycosyltransferase family 2 protein [Planctomycetota bacterium]|nr:MAG: glycosyltransferase family 2 protein [Planctomycetota bacterium]